MSLITRNARMAAGLFCLVTLAAGVARAEDLHAAIKAANQAMQAAVAKGDAAALAALYATDGEVMPVGMDPIKGTEALQKFWKGVVSGGIGGVTLKTLELYPAAGTATEVGEYTLTDKSGKTTLDKGRYVVVWKKVGESWKLYRDIFATSVPTPPPAH